MIKILLEAPILTKSGYGEHSRLVYRALKSKGLSSSNIHINPLNWGNTGWISSQSQERQEIEQSISEFVSYTNQCNEASVGPEYDIHIHVGIPNEFTKKGKYSVCVTAGIETDRVSANWLIKTHQGIDKLIVPSTHSKMGFEKTSYQAINQQNNTETLIECGCPIDVVPYPVKKCENAALDLNIDTEFNFLTVALWGVRKNLESTVRWFIEEFKDQNVGLILKTSTVNGSVIDREQSYNSIKALTSKYPDKKCKVYLLHGDMSEAELHSLYTRDDIHAYVTTTHGEGFGLPIFEAAYSGMPIIATDWSSYLDFLVAPYKESGKLKNKKLFAKVDFDLKKVQKSAVWKDIIEEQSQWAYPKKISFQKQLRSVHKNYGMYKKWANALKEHILHNYTEEKIFKQMAESLMPEDILPSQEWLDTLNEIEII